MTLPIYRGREKHGKGREVGDKGTGSGRAGYGRREVLKTENEPTNSKKGYVRGMY